MRYGGSPSATCARMGARAPPEVGRQGRARCPTRVGHRWLRTATSSPTSSPTPPLTGNAARRLHGRARARRRRRCSPSRARSNLSETVFVFPPEQGGTARIRIFTPRASSCRSQAIRRSVPHSCSASPLQRERHRARDARRAPCPSSLERDVARRDRLRPHDPAGASASRRSRPRAGCLRLSASTRSRCFRSSATTTARSTSSSGSIRGGGGGGGRAGRRRALPPSAVTGVTAFFARRGSPDGPDVRARARRARGPRTGSDGRAARMPPLRGTASSRVGRGDRDLAGRPDRPPLDPPRARGGVARG